ncbi:Hypothetical protein AA314_07629 [Archangium gephyra]|uniref:Uncharacterized protein n=1 Tax=Archangium gephyra TaxID=48 RepID=A0AAC8QE15_9BACT|nr:Hypothetical protein AA314_07629 [Archangium gephyra]
MVAEFASAGDFLGTYQREISVGGLLVRGATLPPGASLGACVVAVSVAGQSPVEVQAQIAAAVPGVGVAVMFPSPPAPLVALAERLRAPVEQAPSEQQAEPEGEEPPAPAHNPLMSARLAAMTVTEKMQLALSGDREARAYLLRDTNKALHVYVLRNPRLGLDEVIYAAKMPSLSPDALKLIAEHREWGVNTTVCTALARNPRTPVPLVLKLLPRVPMQELRTLAKGQGRAPIVQAARKLVLNEH